MSDTIAIGSVGTPIPAMKRLIELGWTVTDAGLWTNGLISEPQPHQVALAIAETLSKSAKPASVKPEPFWTHFSSSPQGTWAIGFGSAFVMYVAMNPPEFLHGEAAAVVKYVLGGVTVALGANQLRKSSARTDDATAKA